MKYSGFLSDYHIPNSYLQWYGGDNSNTYNSYIKKNDKQWNDWGYQFNSQGFRSEEINPNATKKIFTIGCSHTFGEGIPFKDTWSQQFKKLYEADNPSEIVNTLNFSQVGGSNDYIARMCLTQLSEVIPDLLVVQFSYIDRAEYVNGNEICGIGPWFSNSYTKAYLVIHDHLISLINTIKNMLQVQFYCEEHNIDYIFSMVGNKWLSDLFDNEAVSDYYNLLNKENMVDFEIDDMKCDTARDLLHLGTKTNYNISLKYYDFYKKKRDL